MTSSPPRAFFGYEAAPAVLAEVVTHAERAYPNVACGLVLGPSDARRLSRVRPIPHLSAGKEHSFVTSTLHNKLTQEATEAGLSPRVLYHSHCDGGAGLSPLDRAQAAGGGGGWPGLMQLVVSVRRGRFEEMAGYAYDAERDGFSEQRFVREGVSPLGARSIPDDGRLIPPVGGALRICQLADNELPLVHQLTAGRRVLLRHAQQVQDLDRLARGFYSPVTGFQRELDLRSLRAVGRLPHGPAWRHPVVLEVSAADAAEAQRDAIIELCHPAGHGLAAMAINERRELPGGQVALAGPVFAYPVADGQDAAQIRAALLKRGARRVLAVPPHLAPMAARADLSEFDLVVGTGPLTGALGVFGRLGGGHGWIQAAMAQNLGATHICLPEDASLRRVVRDTLQIQPWPPFSPV